MDTLANSEDPDEMPHYAANAALCGISLGSTLFAQAKPTFRKKKMEIIACDPSLLNCILSLALLWPSS